MFREDNFCLEESDQSFEIIKHLETDVKHLIENFVTVKHIKIVMQIKTIKYIKTPQYVCIANYILTTKYVKAHNSITSVKAMSFSLHFKPH